MVFDRRIYCIFLLFIALIYSPNAHAASKQGEVNQANRLLKAGKFDESIEHYKKALNKDADSPLINYNLGTGLYKKGDYQASLDYLRKATNVKDKDLSAKGLYNLGNALYKNALALENDQIDEAIVQMQESLGQYEQASALNPKDEDATYNHKFVEQELERLKKKQKEQQDKKNQPQDNDQKQKDQQGKEQEQKNNQDKNQDSNDQKKQEDKEQKKQEDKSKEEKENKKDSASKDESKQQDQQQKIESQADGQSVKEMTQKEAKDILQDYQRNEEPKGLLNFVPKSSKENLPAKDW